ncbi:nuclear pore complex protein Nup98-Nup96-like [Gigantopelta aegis]|uniref:nuclear pore complex protein Nup98-Nup96-like n=1 Tax=Gigantopelta aegis TaxID=1735272 RepID=UPI001B889224|nr:nuclear pore complex protein Nup98-Nup96-like [Gigantopelta aegis]XP_041359203.1 nuclear pore complex protein Nup98-Nup96-like [Gigantopelta aegis]
MFGPNKSSFGFGAGASTFGSATPFGQSSSTFGAKQPPAFGSQTPATGGLFGTAGTGGLFGQTQTTSTFGQSSNLTFGSTPASTASASLFGTQTPTGGLFSTPASSAFGSKAPGFGSFGIATSTAATGGLFNQTPTQATVFGQSRPVFGGATTQNGTTIKFNPPQGQDTMMKNGTSASIQTRHQCITAMKEYENKSLEELRVEDYLANRKGKQDAATVGIFGSTSTANPTTGFAFGQASQSTGAFGTNTSTSSGGLFGQTQPAQTGGLFGASKPLFGNTATSTGTGFGFGASTNQATSLFGQTQAAKPTLFGATPAASTQPSLFGASTSTFGQSGGFGTAGFGTQAATTGGLFGNKPAGFGATTTTASPAFGFGTGSNLFAKPMSSASTFGFGTASAAPSFGAAQSGSLFGGKPAGFGAPSTSLATGSGAFNFGGNLTSGSTGLFGAAASKPSGFGFGGTSATAPAFGGLGAGTSGFNIGAPASLGLTTQLTTANDAQLQQQLQALASSPFGDSPLFWNLKQNAARKDEVLKPTNPAAQKAALSSASQYKVSPRPTAKIKPKSLHSLMNGTKSQLFEGLEDDDFSFGNDTFMPRKSVKTLVLKKNQCDSSASRGSSLIDENPNMSSVNQETPRITRPITRTLVLDLDRADRLSEMEPVIHSGQLTESGMDSPTVNNNANLDDTIAMLNAKNKADSLDTSPNKNQSNQDDGDSERLTEQQNMVTVHPHPTGIELTRTGYYTVPSLDELTEMMDENGDCLVDDFTIGRIGYGSVFFPGTTNVVDLNLDEIVHFRRKEVIVYPDDNNKPPLGEGLNKKAEVTLDCVWPVDKSNRSPIKNADRLIAMNYQEKIEEITAKIGAKFIDYRPETGSWVFEVKHFSKYGLVDDSDDEDPTEKEKKRLKLSAEQQLKIQKLKIQQQELLKQQQQQGAAGLAEEKSLSQLDMEEQQMAAAKGFAHLEKDIGDYDDDADMQDYSDEFEEEEDTEKLLASSHRIAKSMEVNAHSMQVMKASFFGEDELEEEHKDKLSSFAGSLLKEKSVPSLFSPALKSKYMSPLKLSQSPVPREMQQVQPGIFSQNIIAPEARRPAQSLVHPPHTQHQLLDSGMSWMDIPKRIVGSRIRRHIPPVSESLMYKRQKLAADAGCFMGRSFRVGWGPAWTLVHSGVSLSAQSSEQVQPAPFTLLPSIQGTTQIRPRGKLWTVSLEKLNVAEYLSGNDKMVVKNHEEMLRIQLENSVKSDENGCPVFTPNLGVKALHEYAAHGEEAVKELCGHPDQDGFDHIRMVWNLCVALWGNLPELREPDTSEYSKCQARREIVSRWLSSTADDKIKQEVQESQSKNQGHLLAIFSYLSGRNISEACSIAQASSDHRLALLLAQAAGSEIPRQMLARQLNGWAELGTNRFIHELRLKIYTLLSGQLVWPVTQTPVNTCQDLDWKRALALHLWYYCKPNSAVHEALTCYEHAFKGETPDGKYCKPPLPPYMENEGGCLLDDEDDEHAVLDTCYHLLKLYSERGHRLERLLNPTTSTFNQLDYRLSWHLWQVIQSLEFSHISPYYAACLHTNFAAQLEAMGMWEWAIFVLFHIDDVDRRKVCVCQLLERHVCLPDSKTGNYEVQYFEKEVFVKEQLHVPSVWIHYAKALKARSVNEYHDEAWHLLKACQWNESHAIIVRHIAADAIINENYDYLRRYLVELAPPERSSSILNWNTGGKVFFDYIILCENLEELEKENPSPYDLDKLQSGLTSLCNRVGNLECCTSKDRLCQSEMAKKSAKMLRTLLTLHVSTSQTGRPLTKQLAPHTSSLPMVEDYNLQELNELTRSYLLELTV